MIGKAINALKTVFKKKIDTSVLYIIGAGHGGVVEGKYQTRGKRSPKPLKSTGKHLYEGVNNRDNAKRLVNELTKRGLYAIELIKTEKDTPLKERAQMVNKYCKTQKCVYIDLHSDGFGNGKEWHTANGFSVFVYTKASVNSKNLASDVSYNLESRLYGSMRNRGVKKANFHALRETNCPAILIEGGFHTNEKEAEYILTDKFKTKFIRGIVDGVTDYHKSIK